MRSPTERHVAGNDGPLLAADRAQTQRAFVVDPERGAEGDVAAALDAHVASVEDRVRVPPLAERAEAAREELVVGALEGEEEIRGKRTPIDAAAGSGKDRSR